MKQADIFKSLCAEKNLQHFDNLAEIHLATKHYLLLAEELSAEGVAFLQPLKEHRDAYDHLMRIFALPHRKSFPDGFNEDFYITDNLKKAYGHAYRAFFDTADWLTFICRKYIREALLNSKVRQKYIDAGYSLDDAKKIINEVPFKIAKYREGKDISDDKKNINEVKQYQETLEQLLEIYQNICDLSL